MNINHKSKSIVLLFIFALVYFTGAAQSLEFKSKNKHFTTNDGLSNNTTNSIVQDKFGFIWIGTANGLNRFDGYDFVQYKNSITDSNSISDNYILGICLARDGNIWVATKGGLNLFDYRTETFRQYKHNRNNANSIANNLVSSVYEDELGYIWIGAYQTLDRLDPRTGIFTHYTLPKVNNSYQSLAIEAIISYDKDLFVSVWGAGIYRFNRKTAQFTAVKIIDESQNIQKENWIHDFFINKEGHLFAIDQALLKYNKSTNSFSSFYLKDINGRFSINCIAEISPGKYITGSANNRFNSYDSLFDLEGTSILNTERSVTDYEYVNKILVSNSGEVWFTTLLDGLIQWETHLKKFTGFEYQPHSKNSIPISAVSDIVFSQSGNIWLGSWVQGIAIFDAQKQSFRHIEPKKNGLNKLSVSAVYEDRQGNKWIGTWGGGLNKIDAKTGEYSYYPMMADSSTSLLDNFVTAITQSPDDKIWVTTTRGLSVIDPKSSSPKIRSFIYKSDSKYSPSGLRIDAILCDHKGNIWLGTDGNGLSRYDPLNDTFEHFDNNNSNTKSLGSNKINTLFEDSKNRIWVGCSGGGLNLYVPTKKAFIQFDEKDGLSSNQVLGITEDNAGILWISSDKGLSRFDVANHSIKNYTVEDGLISNLFQVHSISKSPVDGKIYAGTVNGMVSFYPDSIVDSKFIPPVYITSFKTYRSRGSQTIIKKIKAIEHLTQIELAYNENTFTINFVALNYSNSKKNQYAYKLEGASNNWVTLGSIRELTFSKLPPGEYILQIKASNSDKVWNEKGTSLKIKILSPWWLSWWAYILYLLTAVGILYALFRFRTKQLLQRQKDLADLRTKISSDLHDDVGTLLSGLAMQSQILTYTAKEEQKEPLNEISNMSRDAMESMRDTVWAMDSRKDKYENLIDRMRDFAEKNLAAKNMTHEFIIAAADTKKFINPDMRQAIYLIFKEAITNIIKHSDGKHVVIHFTEERNKTTLRIADNGTSQPTSFSDGLGLSNMKMRAEKIGGTLVTKYENGFVVELQV